MKMKALNAITIDVEEWHHVCLAGADRLPVAGERRVRRNVELILALLQRAGARGTFFILGSVAAEEPELAPMIAAAGHEIASHGWSHRLVNQLSPAEFRDEIERTGDLLERQCGVRPVGFRAPQWSLSRSATPWAFEILAQCGYLYDSSLNPLPFVGDPRGGLAPFRMDTPAGGLLEIPPLVLPTLLGNLPVGGGWGFRFFPQCAIVRAIRRQNRLGAPAVLYLHPREVDPLGPRLELPPLQSFAAYGTRKDASDRLGALLGDFQFTTLGDLAERWDSA